MATDIENIRDLKNGCGLMPHPNVCRLTTKACRLTTLRKITIDNEKLDHVICFIAADSWVNLPRYHKVAISKCPKVCRLTTKVCRLTTKVCRLTTKACRLTTKACRLTTKNSNSNRLNKYIRLIQSFSIFSIFSIFSRGACRPN